MLKGPKTEINEALLDLQGNDTAIDLIDQVLAEALEYCEKASRSSRGVGQGSLSLQESEEDLLHPEVLQNIAQKLTLLNQLLATQGSEKRVGPETDNLEALRDWTVKLVFEYLRERR